METVQLDLTEFNVSRLARMIRKNWAKPFYGALPYIDAMVSLDKISDKYINDPGTEIVARFLCNANTWKGDTARQIKKELKRRLKEG